MFLYKLFIYASFFNTLGSVLLGECRKFVQIINCTVVRLRARVRIRVGVRIKDRVSPV